MTADRPTTEPRTEAEINRKAREIVGLFDEPAEEQLMTDAGRLAHLELHRFSHSTATPCPGPTCPHKRIVADIEAEAAQGAAPHARTYSLVGGGLDMFLVTDDESGINIGYARKIGGPITRGLSNE